MPFLRYLDAITLLAGSSAALAADLGTAIEPLESPGMSLRAEKSKAAWLGTGEPPCSRLALPGRSLELAVNREIDFLGIHVLDGERCPARETTVNRFAVFFVVGAAAPASIWYAPPSRGIWRRRSEAFGMD